MVPARARPTISPGRANNRSRVERRGASETTGTAAGGRLRSRKAIKAGNTRIAESRQQNNPAAETRPSSAIPLKSVNIGIRKASAMMQAEAKTPVPVLTTASRIASGISIPRRRASS